MNGTKSGCIPCGTSQGWVHACAQPTPKLCAKLAFFAAILYGLVPGVAVGEALYNQPVYEPGTGSYFELRRATPGYSLRGGTPAIGWSRAQILASQSIYKGVNGRLAIVKSKDLNDFLRRTFKPDWPAWIGLRYWCELNMLQWVTGEFHERTAYANWDRVWRHDGGTRGGSKQPACDRDDKFWPVHYWPVETGFRWNANGNEKEMRAFFIEYPTGNP